MLQVDLSTLSGPEIRRLLDAARSRGQATLAYQILQEMAARREREDGKKASKRLFAGKAASEPRLASVDLGDPLERHDDMLDEPPPAPEPEPEPEPLPPLTSAAWEPSPEAPAEVDPIRIERPKRAKPPREPREPGERRRSPWLAGGFAAGLAAGIGLGWVGANAAREEPEPQVAAFVAGTPGLKVGPTDAAPAPAATPPAAPTETPTVQVAQLPPAEAPAVTPPPPAEPAAPAQEQAAVAPVAPEPEKADVQVADAAARPAPVKALHDCAAQPTPADQTICADPKLQRLQRELRDAYAQALEAHEDRALLRQHQLEWAEARNDISEPDRLARLYEQRIRKLNAATAEARRGH